MFGEITTVYHKKHIINIFQIVSMHNHGDTKVLNLTNGEHLRVTNGEFENNIKKLIGSVSF